MRKTIEQVHKTLKANEGEKWLISFISIGMQIKYIMNWHFTLTRLTKIEMTEQFVLFCCEALAHSAQRHLAFTFLLPLIHFPFSFFSCLGIASLPSLPLLPMTPQKNPTFNRKLCLRLCFLGPWIHRPDST